MAEMLKGLHEILEHSTRKAYRQDRVNPWIGAEDPPETDDEVIVVGSDYEGDPEIVTIVNYDPDWGWTDREGETLHTTC